jgi:hypothetical protein
VYFGANLSGKRTNLTHIQDSGICTAADSESVEATSLLSLAVAANETFKRKMTLHTLTEEAVSPLWMPLLKDVHGLVFVSDSDPERYEDNVIAMSEIIGKLAAYRIKIENFPFIIQYNKRDIAGAVSIPKFEDELNPLGLPAFNAVAKDGTGVMECLKAIAYLCEKAAPQG